MLENRLFNDNAPYNSGRPIVQKTQELLAFFIIIMANCMILLSLLQWCVTYMLMTSGQLATMCLCLCVFLCWQQMSACKHVCLNLLSSLKTAPFRKAASVCVPVQSTRAWKYALRLLTSLPCAKSLQIHWTWKHTWNGHTWPCFRPISTMHCWQTSQPHLSHNALHTAACAFFRQCSIDRTQVFFYLFYHPTPHMSPLPRDCRIWLVGGGASFDVGFELGSRVHTSLVFVLTWVRKVMSLQTLNWDITIVCPTG